MLLGFQSVRAIALGLGAFHLLSNLRKGGDVLEGFWKESMATAVIAQELADLFDVAVGEEAFVAGLLHDVGKLVLSEYDPEAACDLYGGDYVGPELLAAEREAFGVDHTEVAGELGRRWELPDVLQRAMTNHHRHFVAPPPDRGDLLAFLVAAAKMLTGPLSAGGDVERDVASKTARIFRKPVGTVFSLLQRLPAKIAEYADFFEIDIDDLKAYTLWVEQENQRLNDVFSRQEDERRQVERQRAEMAAIREVHALLVAGGGPEAPVRRTLRAAREIAGSRRTVLALVETSKRELRPYRSDGDVAPAFLEGFRFPLDEGGVLAEALRGSSPIAVFDTKIPYFRRVLTARELRVLDTPSFAAVAVRRGDEAVGVLYADRVDGDEPFSDEELEALATLANLLSLALRN